MYKESCLVLMLFFLISSFAGASSIDIIQKGISGSITSTISVDMLNTESDTEYTIIGTQLGVYIISDEGVLLNFIQTGSMITNIQVIEDLNNNNYREIVFTMVNSYFPNVLCYDCLTGEKIWEFSSETEIFDMAMLWTMKQVNVFDLEKSTDGRYLYLSSGYEVICLDSQTGEKVSSYLGTDNFWDITIVEGDVIAGDQNGYVYRFEGESLSLVWKKLICKSYTVVNPSTKSSVGEVTRSVWDIVEIEKNGQKKILLLLVKMDFYICFHLIRDWL